MSATSLDLSQIKTDALSAASTFRTLIGLGTGNTPTFLGASLTGGTVTASAPLINATQTWNSGGVTFNGLLLNVTDTASAAASTLLDLRVGGSSKVVIDKYGQIKQAAAVTGGTYGIEIGNGASGGASSHSYIRLKTNWGDLNLCSWGGVFGFQAPLTVAGTVNINSDEYYGISSGTAFSATADTRLYRDAAGILAQRNAGNAQRFNLYGAFTDASNYRRLFLSSTTAGAFTLGVEGAGTGASGNSLTINLSGDPVYDARLEYNGGGINLRCGAPSFVYQFFHDGFMPGTANTGSVGHEGYSRPWNYIYANRYSAAGQSLTGSQATSLIDASATWNTTGTPTAFKLNVTDTASNASSLLMDLQVGGTSRLNLNKAGKLSLQGSGTSLLAVGRTGSDGTLLNVIADATYSNVGFLSILDFLHCERYGNSLWLSSFASSNYRQWQVDVGASFVKYSQGTRIEWYGADYRADLNASDLVIRRDAAQTLAQRNAGNAQRFNLYGTYTDASNYRRLYLNSTTAGAFTLGVEGAGTGASGNTLELQTGGTTRLTIGTTGVAAFSGRVIVPEFITETVGNDILAGVDATGYFFACGVTSNTIPVFLGTKGTSTHVYIAGTTGVICARGKSIAFGTTTSNTSLISESSGTLSLVNQADSQSFRIYNTFTSSTNFERLNLRWASNEFILDAEAGSGGGTLRGIKIGGAATSLLGFYGATPVDRPDTVADPAGGGTVDAEARTAINAIIDRLQELGLIA
jgi:hypothetical protein